MSQPLFRCVAVIGLGLIGSSLARAMAATGAAGTVVGYDSDAGVRDRASAIGLTDRITDDLTEAINSADVVILCVPPGACGRVAQEMAPHLVGGTIVTDVASVKSAIIADVQPHLPPGVTFVPGHPIAGTENSGPEAGFAELFQGRWCILTPTDDSDPEAVAQIAAFWRHLGSDVEEMTPDHHDRVLAITSHLPHLIAYNIVGTAADLESVTESEVIKFSASGFRDFTRLAASDPIMWRDVCLNNREAVLEMLGRFSEDLSALQRAIRWSDGDALTKLFARTRAIRRSIIDAGQDTDEPDFGRPHPPLGDDLGGSDP